MMSAPRGTPDLLLDALRDLTDRSDLRWAVPPAPLSGGFWAEMFTVELADPPAALAGRLVARVMPDEATAAFETGMQRHLHAAGVAVPAVRAAAGPSEHIDRAWMLMEHVDGQPLLAGLSAIRALREGPSLLRRLPVVLADAAAAIHACPTIGIERALQQDPQSVSVDGFLQRLAAQAASIHRPDLVSHAHRLVEPLPATPVICHGDLHPFNILVHADTWTVIDWSTAVLADRHYDLAFTTLMLANPPLGGSAPARRAVAIIGRRLAQRFLHAYEQRSGQTVDLARLTWGRQVHALRAVVEVASWEAAGSLREHAGHPWLAMRPVLEAHLPRAS
jgi:aminoglycoside phosphotransferase (APT) family kinase protein